MNHLELPPTQKTNYRFRKGTWRKGRRDMKLPAQVAKSSKEIRMHRLAVVTNLSKAVAIMGVLFVTTTFAVKTWREHSRSRWDTRVSRIHISGNLPPQLGGLTQADVKVAAGLTSESSLWQVDLNAVKDKVSLLPQIRHVEVERLSAGEIRIQVEERLPLAWLVCKKQNLEARDSRQGRLLDNEMHLLTCRTLTDTLADLPEIRVSEVEMPAERSPVQDYRIRDALNLLSSFERTNWPYAVQVTSIDVTPTFFTRMELSDGALVECAVDDSEMQVAKLASLYHYVDQKRADSRIATVRLQQTKNVALTFQPKNIPEENQEKSPELATVTPKAPPAPAPRASARGSAVPSVPPANRALAAAKVQNVGAARVSSGATASLTTVSKPRNQTPNPETSPVAPAPSRPIRRLLPEAAPNTPRSAPAPTPAAKRQPNAAAIEAILGGA